jgi:hypothetical protein
VRTDVDAEPSRPRASISVCTQAHLLVPHPPDACSTQEPYCHLWASWMFLLCDAGLADRQGHSTKLRGVWTLVRLPEMSCLTRFGLFPQNFWSLSQLQSRPWLKSIALSPLAKQWI